MLPKMKSPNSISMSFRALFFAIATGLIPDLGRIQNLIHMLKRTLKNRKTVVAEP